MASGTQHETEVLDQVIVRFAGDSGDGMQLTGDRFTTSSALMGNDLSTFPDFPAEIRAPAGTVNGVSAFQVHISDHDILTPGDSPNVLVAMNPAALKANIELMAKGTVLIVNSDSFEERDLAKAGYAENPLTDGSLAAYTVYEVPMTSITQEVCKEAGVKPRDAERSKNFFALGLISWMYTRPVEPTVEWIAERFGGRPLVADANTRAFRAGYDFGETAELFESNYEVRPATFEKGEYVQVTGNQALAWGLIAGSRMAGVPLFLGSYPITPASDILHELSRRKEFGVRTFQAEDEIAGIGAALGASFGGALGCHHDERPGPGPQVRDHRPRHQPRAAPRHRRRPAGRAFHRAADEDRAGRPVARHVRPPRGGAPADPGAPDAQRLLRRRHRGGPAGGEVPHAGDRALGRLPGQRRRALAPARPRLLRARSSPPSPPSPTTWTTTAPRRSGPTCAIPRPWPAPGRRRACPGWSTASAGWRRRTAPATSPTTGSTTSAWCTSVATRSPASPADIPPVEVNDETGDAQLLLVSWGSTYAAVAAGVKRVRARGMKAAHVHLRHLYPLPANLGEVLHRYTQVLVPEVNLGQLSRILRAEYLVDAQTMSKMQGVPFRVGEIEAAITALLGGKS